MRVLERAGRPAILSLPSVFIVMGGIQRRAMRNVHILHPHNKGPIL